MPAGYHEFYPAIYSIRYGLDRFFRARLAVHPYRFDVQGLAIDLYRDLPICFGVFQGHFNAPFELIPRSAGRTCERSHKTDLQLSGGMRLFGNAHA